MSSSNLQHGKQTTKPWYHVEKAERETQTPCVLSNTPAIWCHYYIIVITICEYYDNIFNEIILNVNLASLKASYKKGHTERVYCKDKLARRKLVGLLFKYKMSLSSPFSYAGITNVNGRCIAYTDKHVDTIRTILL